MAADRCFWEAVWRGRVASRHVRGAGCGAVGEVGFAGDLWSTELGHGMDYGGAVDSSGKCGRFCL